MKKIYISLVTLILALGFSVSGHATLIDMGDGTIYDTDLQLSWLQNANTNGLINWFDADIWANSLNDLGGFAGLTGWRLPAVVDVGNDGCNGSYLGTDCGYNVDTATSEMAHLFYDELGNKSYYDTSGVGYQTGWGLTNTGPFTNLQPYFYWSGTEYAPVTYRAWGFSFDFGNQEAGSKSFSQYALAVRPGQRSTSVPEPATLLLLGSGLAGIIVLRRKLKI